MRNSLVILVRLWTVNDVTGKYPLNRPQGIFTASQGSFKGISHGKTPQKL